MHLRALVLASAFACACLQANTPECAEPERTRIHVCNGREIRSARNLFIDNNILVTMPRIFVIDTRRNPVDHPELAERRHALIIGLGLHVEPPHLNP